MSAARAGRRDRALDRDVRAALARSVRTRVRRTLDPTIDEPRLLDRRHVGPPSTISSCSLRHLARHPLREERWRERVALACHDQHRNVHFRQEILRAVLAGCAKHAEEHRKVDVGHVPQVRHHVLGVDPLGIDLPPAKRQLQRDVRGNARPDRARQVGALQDGVEELGEDPLEHGDAVEGLGDLAEAPADEDEPANRLPGSAR